MASTSVIIVVLFLLLSTGMFAVGESIVDDNNITTYDLVIIAPKTFSRTLQPLIKHKNNHNLETILKTTEEIYAEYEGRDKPEQIKYFIKDALETWNINYVLLVGGIKGQRNTWYVPPRYSNLDDWSDWDFQYLSDLYYADIYKNNGTEFDDWDSNGNGIFAEWSRDSIQKDILDLYPDVYVGRLACRNIIEVANVVKKIIIYETQTYGKAWFNHMILAAGDTFPNPYNEFEGEMEANRSASYMASLGVDVTRLFASDGTLTVRKDVIQAMNQGSGFMHFAGHGNPSIWSTYPSNDIDTWIDGLSIADMGRLRNRNKLPICVIGYTIFLQMKTTLALSGYSNGSLNVWVGGWSVSETLGLLQQ